LSSSFSGAMALLFFDFLNQFAKTSVLTSILKHCETKINSLHQIRELSEHWGKSSERLQRELELARERGNRPTIPRDDMFFVSKYRKEKINGYGSKT
jgi:hypothetical protein